MQNKKLHLAAILLLTGITGILLVGCKKETPEKPVIPNNIQTHTVAKPVANTEEEKTEEKLPQLEIVDVDTSTLSDNDAAAIAEQLKIMWGPNEEDETQSSENNGGENSSSNHNWRTMTPEELASIQKAREDAKENEAKNTNETSKDNEEEESPEETRNEIEEQKEQVDKDNTDERESEENEENKDSEENEDVKEEQEKNEEEKPARTEEETPTKENNEEKKEADDDQENEIQDNEPSREQLILEIIGTINKYTSEKSQQRYLKESLGNLEGYEDEIGLLLDIKSFLPEKLHSDINTRITEIIAQEREEK